MPELPDLTVVLDALEARILGQRLDGIRVRSPFLVRTFDPPLGSAEGRRIVGLRRVGKRIVLECEADEDGPLFLVVHLMIAGRFRWRDPGAKIPGRIGLAAFDFEPGCLILTEAAGKKRASLHCVREGGLAALDPGGLEVSGATDEEVGRALRERRHTLKRALTDPHILAGIGNAYSDEILHRARMSPFKRTADLSDEELTGLVRAIRDVLDEWTERLRIETRDAFPEKLTAFRDGMAVHGRFREPCPDCGAPVQRIVRGETEANYCPVCQTGGRILADRALSRLLKDDWPRTLEELENRRRS